MTQEEFNIMLVKALTEPEVLEKVTEALEEAADKEWAAVDKIMANMDEIFKNWNDKSSKIFGDR